MRLLEPKTVSVNQILYSVIDSAASTLCDPSNQCLIFYITASKQTGTIRQFLFDELFVICFG